MQLFDSSTLIFISLIHFLADFALQTHDQAINKSKSNRWLFYHVGVYSLIWLIAIVAYGYSFDTAFIFSSITLVAHFVTDWITSRIGKPFWEKNDYHNGFVVIGFDQLLHFIQLIYCWEYIIM